MQQTNLYTVTIPPLVKTLTALKSILEKAKAHTDTKKLTWMDFEHALLTDKLVFNQFDFKKQVQVACDNAKGAAARLAEVEVPKHDDTEATFADLVGRIDKTLAFIATIQPEQIVGKEDIKVTLPYWPGKYFTGFEYATEYVLPNFYFHVTTAYAILRKNGIDVGKNDFLGDLPLKDA
jgi:uncharacterized protein